MRRYIFLLLLMPAIFFAASCHKPQTHPHQPQAYHDITELAEPRSWKISKHIAIIDAYDGKHAYDTTITYPDTTFTLIVKDKYTISIPGNQYLFAVDDMPYATTTIYYGQVTVVSFSKNGQLGSNILWDANVLYNDHDNKINISQQIHHPTSTRGTTSGVGFDTLYTVQASWPE